MQRFPQRIRIAIGALFCVWGIGVLSAALTEDETSLHDAVAIQVPAAIQLLKELVEIPSQTLDIQGVHAVGERLRTEFDQLGFKTYWSDLPYDLHRSGALFASHQTGRHPRILLLGHLDVSPGVTPSQPRMTIKDGRALGPGVVDDKGGDVVILAALKAMKALGWLSVMDVTVALMGDEEQTGEPTTVSRASLRSIAQEQDMVLEFEWAFHLQSATVARRGIGHWRLDVTSPVAHSSRIFHEGVGPGAAFETARILDQIRKRFEHKKNISINPSLSLIGSSLEVDSELLKGEITSDHNAVPSRALVLGDFRYLTWDEKESIEKAFDKISHWSLPHTVSTLTFEKESPPMPPLSANRTLLKLLSQCSEDLGYGQMVAMDPTARGASDLNYVADMIPAQLAGLGPVGGGAHTESEYLELNSLPIAMERVALLLHRLTAD